MRFLISTIFFLFLTSCNLSERVETLKKLEKDLSQTFDHENINAKISWGTEEDANKVSVVFLKFDMNAKNYDTLQNIASQVRNRILEKNPEFKKMDLIEVAFTSGNEAENPGDATTFKFRN